MRLLDLLVLTATLTLSSTALADDAPAPAPTPTPAPAPAAKSFDLLMLDALMHNARGKTDEAVAALTSAAALRPDDARPYERMCTVLYGAGRTDAALVACKAWGERVETEGEAQRIAGLVKSLERRVGR